MAKAKTIPATTEPQMRTFRVSLPFQPTTEVQALTPDDARAEYNRVNGITSTEMKYVIDDLSKVAAPEPTPEPTPVNEVETITS